MNGELELQGLAKNIVAGLPEVSVEPKEEEIKLRAIARQIVAGLPGIEPERRLAPEARFYTPEKIVRPEVLAPQPITPIPEPRRELLEKKPAPEMTPEERLAAAQRGVTEYMEEPGLGQQIKDLSKVAMLKNPAYFILMADSMARGITLGNFEYIVGAAEEATGKQGLYKAVKSKSKQALKNILGYYPEDAMKISENIHHVAGLFGPYSVLLKGFGLVAGALTKIPALQAAARGILTGVASGYLRKPEEEGLVNRLKQMPGDVLFFTAFETGILGASQALKIYNWNKTYKNVPHTVGDMRKLYRKMQSNVAGHPEAYGPLTATEKEMVSVISEKPGWAKAIKEGFLDIPAKPRFREIFERPPTVPPRMPVEKPSEEPPPRPRPPTEPGVPPERAIVPETKITVDVTPRADGGVKLDITSPVAKPVEVLPEKALPPYEKVVPPEVVPEVPKRKPTGRVSTEPISNFVRKQGGLSFASLGELRGEAQPILESPAKKRLIRMKAGGKSLDHITEAAFEAGIIKSEDPAVFLREWSEEIAGIRPAIPSEKEAMRREAEYAEREAERYEPEAIEKPEVPPEAVEPEDLWEGFLERFEEKELTLGEYIKSEVPEAKREVAEASLKDQYADFMRAQLWSPKKIIPLLNQMKVKQPRLRNKEVYRWAQRYMLENYDPELGGPQAYLNKSLVKKFDVTGRPKEVAKLEEFEPLPEEERAREEYITAGKIGEIPEEIYERKALRETVEKIRSKLSPQAQKAMDGIMAGRGLREDAKLMGISHDTVRSIRKDLKKKLKKNKKLASFVETVELHEEIDRQALAIKEFETRLKVKELTEGQLSLQDIFKKVQYKKEGGETLGLFIPGGGIRGMIEEPGSKTFEQWMKEVYLGITPKARKALKKLQDTIEGKVYHNPKTLKKEFDMASMYLPDEFLMRAETVYAEKAVSKMKGYVKPYIEKLREKGIRESVIDKVIIAKRYPIKDLVKIKREATGEISGIIDKKLLDYTRKVSRAKQQTTAIKKFTKDNLKDQLGKALSGFEVPQLFFKRLGLSFIYDQIREGGERPAEVLRRHTNKLIIDMFKGLEKKEREEIFHFFAQLQGYGKEMRMVGIDPKTLDQMNAKQKRAIMKWRAFNRNYGPKVNTLASKHGKAIRMVKNYFPMYARSDIAFVQGEGIEKQARKDPWMRSLIPRKEKVPYDIYEYDAGKNALAFAHAMSNYLEIGKVSVPIKFFIESKDFGKIVGIENQDAIIDWFETVVSPQRGPLFFRWFRRAGYRSFLGLNPVVTAKQGLSYLDVALIEKFFFKMPPHIKQIVRRLDKPSVTERKPEIAVADMTSKLDQFLLWGIIKADQFFAKKGLERVLAAELMAMEAEGINIHNTKVLRKALKRVSDRIDLAMAGVTPAQRPPFYRTEFGKMALMLTSTINSRLQYYLLNASEAYKSGKAFEQKSMARDAFMIAKIITGFLLVGYLEKVMAKISFTWDDARSMAEDIIKSTLGNIPVVGGLIFALDSGEWHVSPVASNFADALEAIGDWSRDEKPIEKPIFEIWEVLGLPTQVQKMYSGSKIIAQGKRLTGRKTLKLDDPIEQFRALVRGQYGPLAVQKYYSIQDRRKDYHKRVAKKFIRFAKGTTLRRDILANKPSWFKKNFWSIVRSMPLSERQDIRKMFKKIEGLGYDLSMQSILNYTKEGLK